MAKSQNPDESSMSQSNWKLLKRLGAGVGQDHPDESGC
jgi:hypothetical protein